MALFSGTKCRVGTAHIEFTIPVEKFRTGLKVIPVSYKHSLRSRVEIEILLPYPYLTLGVTCRDLRA